MAFGLFLLLASPGQFTRPELQVKAIKNARIVVSSSQTIEKGTIVLKGGVIAAVGADVSIPTGAEVLDGAGLTVYPGFIDAAFAKGQRDIPVAGAEDGLVATNETVPTAMRETSPSVHAGASSDELYEWSSPAWKAARKAGFTTALLVPPSGVVRGEAALVELGGRARRRALLKGDAGLVLDPRGVVRGSGYPGTLLGAHSVTRQAFEDARTAREQGVAYESGGTIRPASDAGFDHLLAALDRKTPTLILADQWPRAEGMLRISREFSLSPIIVGLSNGYRDLDSLKASGAQTVLTFAFPPAPVEEKKAPSKDAIAPAAQEKGKDDMAKSDAPKEAAKADPPKAAEPPERAAEIKRLYNLSVSNALAFEKAGFAFSVSSLGVDSQDELIKNLGLAVKAGLSPSSALDALTIRPARLFGLEKRLGTIEVGKIANLTLLTKNLFEEGAKARYVFVEGRKFDLEEGEKANVELPAFEDGKE